MLLIEVCNGQVNPDTFSDKFILNEFPYSYSCSSLLTHRVRGLSTAIARAVLALFAQAVLCYFAVELLFE